VSLLMLGFMASVFGVERRADVDFALVAIAIFPWDDSWCGRIIRKVAGYDERSLHIDDWGVMDYTTSFAICCGHATHQSGNRFT